MAQSLREYFIKFMFRTDKEGASKAQQQLDALKHSFESLGKSALFFNEITDSVNKLTAPFRELGELINATAEEADALGDLSERTGIATQALEEYAYMAKLAGSSQEAMTTGLRILEKNMGEAAHGGKEQAETFAKLGVSIRGANGQLRSVDEMLPELSRAFEKLPDHASKTAYAMKLFGRAGQELIPLLERGPDQIAQMRRELELLGGVTSGEFIEDAALYVDNLDRIAAVWKGVRQAISGPLIKMINELTGGLLKWWKVNGELVRSKISEWFFQLGTSLQALWSTVTRLAAPFILLAAALNVPLLAMIGMKLLIALLIDDFANWMAGNDSLIGRAIKNWDEWINKIAETHPVLAALLDAFGRTVKNMSVLVEGLFNMFNVLIDSFLDGGWDGFMKELGKTFDVAIDGWKDAFSGFIDWVMEGIRSIPGISQFIGMDDTPMEKQFEMAKRRREFDAQEGGAGDTPRRREFDTQEGGISRLPFQPTIQGNASTPEALASRTTTVNAPVNAKAEINVTVPEGQDPRKTAEEISRMWDEKFDSEMRAGFNALVPEAY